jgi:hypothetical protein
MVMSVILAVFSIVLTACAAYNLNEHTALTVKDKYWWYITIGYILGEAFAGAAIHVFLKSFMETVN